MCLALALCCALVAAGCAADTQSSYDEAPAGEGEDGAGGGGSGAPDGVAACSVDTDCVAAASTCCECPSFAVLGSEMHNDGCDEVECEAEPAACPALEPACDPDGVCILRCAPVVTEQSCPGAFVRDQAGCLVDQCMAPSSGQPECLEDTDCVQVPADCCGCARGGEDTAVPQDQVDAHLAGLDCSGDEACPEVDVCDPEALPRCQSGQCTLVRQSADEPSRDGDLCGTAAYPPCPEGQVCVLNAADAPDADQLGVGACRQP